MVPMETPNGIMMMLDDLQRHALEHGIAPGPLDTTQGSVSADLTLHDEVMERIRGINLAEPDEFDD